MSTPTLIIAEGSSTGISSLGINLKGFIFQLITFLLVMLILRRWVFPKLVATLEARRAALEESLAQAKRTQEALERAELKSDELLAKARAQADSAMADAKTRADQLIAAGEAAASERAARIIKDAQGQLGKEREKLHTQLKKELAELVVTTTEKVLRNKIDAKADRALIEKSLKELS